MFIHQINILSTNTDFSSLIFIITNKSMLQSYVKQKKWRMVMISISAQLYGKKIFIEIERSIDWSSAFSFFFTRLIIFRKNFKIRTIILLKNEYLVFNKVLYAESTKFLLISTYCSDIYIRMLWYFLRR